MKKTKFFVLGLFVIVILFASNVYAGTAYTDEVDIYATINKDGSMTVEENIVWDIDGSLNGVYRDVLYKSSNDTNSATDLIVKSVSVNGREYEYSLQELKNGASGKFNVLNIQNGKKIKIFKPSDDEKFTSKITYVLENVVVNYDDIAELYWNFIGDSWSGIEKLNITITLPEESETLKVFAHGPLNGVSEIIDKKTVKLSVQYLGSGEQVDARVVFDNNIVNAAKRVDENKLDDILKVEAKLAEEANIRRENAKKVLVVSIITILVALILPIFLYFVDKKKRVKPEFNGKYYRELPEDYGPAIMNKVLMPMGDIVDPNDMLATLLDLNRKKYIEIEPVLGSGKKPKDYVLKLVNKDLSELNGVERYFIQKLIFVDTDNITLKELKKKNTRNVSSQRKATEAFNTWGEKITDVAIEKEVIKKKSNSAKRVLKIIAPLIFVLIPLLLSLVFEYSDILGMSMVAVFIAIAEASAITTRINMYCKKTKKGIEHEAMWRAFKKFLLDFSKLDEREYNSIVIWEHFLVYAAGLGIAKKVIKQLKIAFPAEFNENRDMITNYTVYNMVTNSNAYDAFSNSFTSAASQAFSAPSSDGNGGGGGFSGGAGGRRRRRRSWRFLILAYLKGYIVSIYPFLCFL